MFDIGIGFLVGIVVGHLAPSVYTSIVSLFKKEEAKFDTPSTTSAVPAPSETVATAVDVAK